MTYDIGSVAISVVVQFTCGVVSNIADPVAQRIIASIKYSIMQLFVSYHVDLAANFMFAKCIYSC